jgi:hypothetical protein
MATIEVVGNTGCESSEKAGVGGSTPSLATILFNTLAIPSDFSNYGSRPIVTTKLWVASLHRPRNRGFAFASEAVASSRSNCCITHPCASIFAGVVERV